ncbi:MAG TPA: tRNA (cytosine(32)/uridine(32)-2'-O)-methyltransferase TrmJ [Gammaproteobacteria bacterium]|jgi:tRNA (cytidine32/uridine32-2'-O)-methyltransferase|nr:tRNA (cytosine(32)/uridine(32)-2'-O)-methyltransferase TrmJ [Gammaproteobacteria bacterium]
MKHAVRIVLVETSHAGNIGATARAMKNMSVEKLCLVRPCKFRTYDAYARSSGANDIIDNATVCNTLQDALVGCTRVYGTSARARSLEWQSVDLRSAATELGEASTREDVAVVFGNERSGLSNEDLALCHRRLHIPTNPSFSSLNVAAAVQLVVYELGQVMGAEDTAEREVAEPVAPVDDVERFYTHLQQTLEALEFLDPAKPRQLMRRLRRLYNRARPTSTELSILRGILAAADKCVAKTRGDSL